MDEMFKTIEEVQLLLNNLIPNSHMAVGGLFALYVAGIPLDRMSPSVYEMVTNPDPETIKRVLCTRGTIEGIGVSEEALVFLNNARDFDDLVDRVIISAGIKGIHIESKEKTYLGYSLKFYTNSDDTIIIDVLDDVLPF